MLVCLGLTHDLILTKQSERKTILLANVWGVGTARHTEKEVKKQEDNAHKITTPAAMPLHKYKIPIYTKLSGIFCVLEQTYTYVYNFPFETTHHLTDVYCY